MDDILDMSIPGLKMYGECKRQFRRAEHLLNSPDSTRKELLQILWLFEKNKDSVGYLQDEFGERFDEVESGIKNLFNYYAKSLLVVSELEKRMDMHKGLFLESARDKPRESAYAQTSSNALMAMAYLMNNEKQKAFNIYNRLRKRKSYEVTYEPSGEKRDFGCVEREYEYINGNAAMAALHYMMNNRKEARGIIGHLDRDGRDGNVYRDMNTYASHSSIGNALIAMLLAKENNERYKLICSYLMENYIKPGLENDYSKGVASDVMVHLLMGSYEKAAATMALAEDNPEMRENILFFHTSRHDAIDIHDIAIYTESNAAIAVAYAMLGGARI